jgi:hypothetical protein
MCAGCGARMNHHADKLIDPSGPDDVALVDPALGGIVEEAHSCPACGESTTRRRAPDRRP